MNPSNSSETKTVPKIWSKFRDWLRYHFCFSKGVFFVSEKEDHEKKDLMKAATLTMILQGVSALLELVVSTRSMPKALFSCLLFIIVSNLFFIIGLVILYVNSTPLYVNFPQNVIGILLLAVGHIGVQRFIGKFIVDQFKNHEPDPANPDKERVKARKNVWCCLVWSFSALAAFLTYKFTYKVLWEGSTVINGKNEDTIIIGTSDKIIFEVSLWASGSSFVLVLCGIIWFYVSGEFVDTGSSLTTIRHDLKAFLIKMKRKKGRESAPSPEQGQQIKRKYFREMGCMWTTFLWFGLVLSAGKALFPILGEDMVHTNFLPLLVIIQSISRKLISFPFELLFNGVLPWVPEAKNRKVKLVKVWLGILLSIPCYIVAWRVELIRQSKAAMSIFWLVPQFCMLGFMEGLAQDGLNEFMFELFPESREKKHYVSAINSFVIGLGNFGNIISIYANSSFLVADEENHIAKYFIVLTIVSSVNLCYHSCISLNYYHKRKNTPETSQIAPTSDDQTTKRSGTTDLNKQSKFLSELMSAIL